MRVDAFLCDAATVRENLLHVLGGGVTRLWRERFPADLGVTLAMMIAMTPSEAAIDHVLQVTVIGSDGEPIAQLDGEIGAQPAIDHVPGEDVNVPAVLPLQRVPLPGPGQYSVNVLIDRQQKASLSVSARHRSEKPG